MSVVNKCSIGQNLPPLRKKNGADEDGITLLLG